MKTALLFLVCMFPLLSAHADKALEVTDNRLPKEAVDALNASKELILYSLDPGSLRESPRLGPEGSLNGFKILGHLSITDPKPRSLAVTALNEAFQAADYHLIALCFWPRHAVRVIENGKTFDFMICYQCGQIQLYHQGVRGETIGIPNAPEALNKLLTEAKIPLAKLPAPK